MGSTEVSALDNLREHGYVEFFYDFIIPREAATDVDFRKKVSGWYQGILVQAVTDFLIANPDVASWQGSIRRTSSVYDQNHIQYRLKTTVYATDPWS